jgi:hypothetical protein
VAHRTVDQLIASIRQRLGWPADDSFVSYDEMREMLQQSRHELAAFLVRLHQGNFRLTYHTITTVAGQNGYGLTDVYTTVRVAAVFDNVSRPMRRANIESEVLRTDSVAWNSGTDISYRMQRLFPEADGSQTGANMENAIFFYPTPDGAYQVEIYYVYALQTFSATDSLNMLGHDEYLVLDTMIKCIEAEEGDPSRIEARKERYIQAVTDSESPIDLAGSDNIQDVRGATQADPWRWP